MTEDTRLSCLLSAAGPLVGRWHMDVGSCEFTVSVKPKNSEKVLLQCHFVLYTSHFKPSGLIFYYIWYSLCIIRKSNSINTLTNFSVNLRQHTNSWESSKIRWDGYIINREKAVVAVSFAQCLPPSRPHTPSLPASYFTWLHSSTGHGLHSSPHSFLGCPLLRLPGAGSFFCHLSSSIRVPLC